MWRGAAAIAATDILEANGYGVEVIAYTALEGVLKPNS
jgi:hypothetical protein